MTYCVSDIHGEFGLFAELLEKIGFGDNDEMLVCGDMIDKGESTVKLLKFIMSKPNIKCIVGNHEYEFLKYYNSLLSENPNNFDEVLKKLQDFLQSDGHLLDWEVVDWLESLPFFIERETFVCVHAGVELDVNGKIKPLSNTAKEVLVFDRRFKTPDFSHSDEKCIIFGHTPTCFVSDKNSVLAYKRKHVAKAKSITDFSKLHIDTGTYVNGVLGCVCIDSMKAYYVRKSQ